MLFLRKARNQVLSGSLLTELGWFNKGSGFRLFTKKRREKTLFLVFSRFARLVAGRGRIVKSDKTVTKGEEK